MYKHILVTLFLILPPLQTIHKIGQKLTSYNKGRNMKNLSLHIVIYVLLPLLCIAQAPDTLWTKTYGGPNSDSALSVQETMDGGYIVVGETWYPGTPAWEIDVYLIKTHPNGDTIWTRTYDRAATTDKGRAVQQTDDGGYIIAGHTQFIGIDYDVYLIRTNADGDTVWTKTIGDSGAPTPWEEALALDQTSHGGHIIAGFTFSYGAGSCDIWLVKTEPDVGIEECESTNPSSISLHASPNPFTRSTNIKFTPAPLRKTRPGIHDSRYPIEQGNQDTRGSVSRISEHQQTELKIYDATGRLVKPILLPTTYCNLLVRRR